MTLGHWEMVFLLCFEHLRSICEVECFELVCKQHCHNLWRTEQRQVKSLCLVISVHSRIGLSLQLNPASLNYWAA